MNSAPGNQSEHQDPVGVAPNNLNRHVTVLALMVIIGVLLMAIGLIGSETHCIVTGIANAITIAGTAIAAFSFANLAS